MSIAKHNYVKHNYVAYIVISVIILSIFLQTFSNYVNAYISKNGNELYTKTLFTYASEKSTLINSSSNSDLYLINRDDMKVLRVPYLNQDGVGHCWLYSTGMVVAYYTGGFYPDIVLNKLEKGYDVGLYYLWPPEYRRFRETIESLYGIRLSELRSVNKNSLINLIINEISNARPLLLLGRRSIFSAGHVVVIIGYYVNNSGFYIIVNDPSGYFTHDLWRSFKRFDGSFSYGYGDAYGVLVNIDKVFETLSEVYVVTVEYSSVKPNPPKAVVYAFTIRPYAIVNAYNSMGATYTSNSTWFYHNNYLEKSLWLPIPVTKPQDIVNFNIFIYPNTLDQEEFYLRINLTHSDLQGFVSNIVDELSVKIYNYSYAEVSIPMKTRLTYGQLYEQSGMRTYLIFKPWSTGITQVELMLIDKNSAKLVYKWGPVNVYVYDDVSYLSIERMGSKITIVGGVLYQSFQDKNIVDLYVAFRPTMLFTKLTWFNLKRPCLYTLDKPQPDSERGGYYYVCRIEVPVNQNFIDIEGDLVFLLNITFFTQRIREILRLPSSGIYKTGSIEFKEVIFNANGTGKFFIGYEITKPTTGKYELLVDIDRETFKIDLGDSLRDIVETKVNVSGNQIIPVFLGIRDGLGNYVDVVTTKIVNPLIVSILNLSMPVNIVGDSYTFIRYGISMPKIFIDDLNMFTISSSIYINGSETRSTTCIERVVENEKNIVWIVRSDVYVPSCNISNKSECLYVFTIVPKLGIRYRSNEIVYVYSPDVSKSFTAKVFSKDLKVKHVSIVLVIDVSGSMGDMFRGRTKLDWAKEAAINLVNLIFDGDYLGLIAFSSYPSVIQNLTIVNNSTRYNIIQTIESLRPGGNTNIGDSLKLAVDLLNEYGIPGYRKAVILLTDGIHNTGTHPLNVLNYVKEASINVYTIGLGEPGDIDEDILNKIAYETGGMYFYAPTPDKLKEIFDSIRGGVASLNLIDVSLAKLSPSQEIWGIYPLDLRYSDFIVEVSWDRGSEPIVKLHLPGLTVDQRNASLIGIDVSYPTANMLRIRIPSQFNFTVFSIGYSFVPRILPINISILNTNPHEQVIQTNIFGGKEELLEIIIDNPTARYSRGQYLFYRVIAEKDKKVQVTLMDSKGDILYFNILTISDVAGVFSGTMNHFIKLPEEPGTYYLKATLIDVFQLKTRVIPITITDSPYQKSITVSYVNKVKGFGLLKIPVNISVHDRSIIGRTLIIQTKLEPENPYTPYVSVQQGLIKITKPVEENYVYVNVPPNAKPGVYNISLLFYIEGHSVVIEKNAIEVYVPGININLENVVNTVYAYQGDYVENKVKLNIFSDDKYLVELELSPQFINKKASVEGSLDKYRTIIYTNTTLTIPVKYNTSEIGVYTGLIRLSINGTNVNNILQTLVVIPKNSDANKTIWAYSYNSLTLGPEPIKNIEVQLKIDWVSYVAGIISTPINPKSDFDYIVYAYSVDGRAKPLLTLFIPQKFRAQDYVVFIESENKIVDIITLSKQLDVVLIDIESNHVYRVWIEPKTAPSPTQTPTPIYTTTTSPTSTTTLPTLVITTTLTITTISPILTTSPTSASPLIIGGGGIPSPSAISITETHVLPIKLSTIIATIITILTIEISIIILLYIRKRRY